MFRQSLGRWCCASLASKLDFVCCAGNVFLWDRLAARSAGPISPFLAEFAIRNTAEGRQATAAVKSRPGRAVSATASTDALIAVKADVHAAVESIMGSRAGDEQPLMDAGLDSLGEHPARSEKPLST